MIVVHTIAYPKMLWYYVAAFIREDIWIIKKCPFTTRDINGLTADNLKPRLCTEVKSGIWPTSYQFGIKFDRIQGVLTDRAHWHNHYTSCGCSIFIPPCYEIMQMWGEALDRWWCWMLLEGQEWRVGNKEFSNECREDQKALAKDKQMSLQCWSAAGCRLTKLSRGGGRNEIQDKDNSVLQFLL